MNVLSSDGHIFVNSTMPRCEANWINLTNAIAQDLGAMTDEASLHRLWKGTTSIAAAEIAMG